MDKPKLTRKHKIFAFRAFMAVSVIFIGIFFTNRYARKDRKKNFDEDIAKVSLVGTGMKSSPGVAAKAFETLGQNDINILAISTSPIRQSVVVDAAQAAQAVQCLHTAFGLDSDSVFVETQLSAEEIAAKMNKGR